MNKRYLLAGGIVAALAACIAVICGMLAAPEAYGATQVTGHPSVLTSVQLSAPEPVELPREPEMLPEMAELYAQNPEIVGWLEIEGTVLDYPLMHTPDDPEKYLYADFEGNYSKPGTPFMDYRCTLDPPSDNLLLYGHNMKNGTMFREILSYANKSYWEEHPVIKLTTLYEEREYEVLAAFYDRIYLKSYTGFKFYNFVDAADEAEFENAIAYYKENACYETGVTAEYGDQLITLITCAYHVDNGRFVVVARLVDGAEE